MDTSHFTWFDRKLANWRQDQVLHRLLPGERLIDFGCGAEPVLLQKASPYIRWGIGFDYDANNVRQGNILVRKAHITDSFPLPDYSATCVSMTAVIEHFSQEDALSLLVACQKVLLPAGRVILTTPTPQGKWVLEPVAQLTPLVAKAEVFDHKHYYSQNELGYLAVKAGLTLALYKRFEVGCNSAAVLINQ